MQLFQPTAQGIQRLSELMSFSGLTPSTFYLFSLNVRAPDLQITLKVFHMFTLASGKQKFFPYLPSQTKFLPQAPKPLKTASHCLSCSSLRGCMTLGSRRKDASPYKWRILPSRFSRVQLCATPGTAAYQASPSMGFSRQEHWSGLPFPSPMHECGK